MIRNDIVICGHPIIAVGVDDSFCWIGCFAENNGHLRCHLRRSETMAGPNRVVVERVSLDRH
jgi:hypothetical protein